MFLSSLYIRSFVGLVLRNPSRLKLAPFEAPRLIARAVMQTFRRESSTIARAVMKLKRGGGAMKTKSAVKKRFRVTGGGSLKRMPSGKQHLNLHKSSSRIRRLGWWQCLAWGFSVHFHHSCSGIPFTFSPKPPTPLLPSPCAGPQKTIANKGLRKRYLRVMGLSPFKK